ncbi:MAG: hypothetical protein KIT11_04255 [Fimbriimonadaceae bacterium]|nr:hypothetical protein [Fimbriimonadaceae bacterium]QYK56892.1 MAG: hypothetical protein KF733_05270 [Fimbriimonadaceae bacterium]
MSLGRQVVVVVAVSGVAAALAYLFTGFLPRVYQSQASLFFPASSSAPQLLLSQTISSSPANAGDSPLYAAPGGLSSPVIGSSPQTAIGILKSKTCRLFVVDKLELDKAWKLSRMDAAAELSDKVGIRQDENGMVNISVQVESPALAQEIGKALIGHLDSEGVRLTLNLGAKNRQVLESRVKEAERVVDRSEDRLTQVMREHPYTDQDALQELFTTSLKNLVEARAARDASQQKLREIESTLRRAMETKDKEEALQALGGQAGLSQAINSLAAELTKRRIALEDAKKTFTEQSPEFKAAVDSAEAAKITAERTVDQIKIGIDKRFVAPIALAEADFAALDQAVKTYEAALSQFEAMLKRAPSDAAAVQRAKADFENAMRLLASNRIGLEQARITEERDPARYQVIDPPDENPRPVAPRRGLLSGAVGALALALGSWWILRSRVVYAEE